MAATTNKGFGLLFEMGCGKTRTAIAIAGAAYQKGAIQRVLVIAPTSVVSVWPKEIAEVADFKVTCKALLGTKQQRIRMIEDLQAFPFKALKVAVINYESTWRDRHHHESRCNVQLRMAAREAIHPRTRQRHRSGH